MPKFRVRVGIHQQNEIDPATGQQVEKTYRGGDNQVFESNHPVVLNDPAKFERLLDDGRPMNSPGPAIINPLDKRPNETTEEYVARLNALAAQAQAAARTASVDTSEEQKPDPAIGAVVTQPAAPPAPATVKVQTTKKQ